MPKPKPYVKKLKGKTFTKIGEGNEARVWKVKEKDKRKKSKIVRVNKIKKDIISLKRRFIATKIAYLFFPKNIPKPLKLNLEKFRMISKEKKGTKAMQQYFHTMESLKKLKMTKTKMEQTLRAGDILNTQYEKHKETIHQMMGRLSNAGFIADFGNMNISVSSTGHPIFYEIHGFNPAKINAEAKRQGIKGKKLEKLTKLIAEWDKTFTEREAWP